ncbi:PKD domain-containing protein [Frigoriflavimonas asaccharolytica]|uniref:PKD domain-containing protein n=1 Tax=Frigoriflavimonas asaccharolytica TaxID=2735899 RepID=A0A8J8G7Y2_9FLAO|nr:PKD domain-containing protein [Frigoriflavimonas asaccharolytica]NRS92616.1 hypothetical protein [Frigoriflavimonas asaccharolytica]
MKNIFNIKKINFLPLLLTFLLFSLASCDLRYDIAEAGSKSDLTPPSADFEFKQGSGTPDAWKTYTFANASISATDYIWTFPNGTTITTQDAAFTFAGEGTYNVSLKAADKLGVTSNITKSIVVIKPVVPVGLVPVIQAANFDAGNVDATKEPWRNNALGGILQISASSSFDGGFASKFPLAPDKRIAYQELTVSPNTNYIISCKYSQDAGTGTVRIAVLGGSVNNPANINSAIITSVTGANATGKGNFTPVNLQFNSGANSTIAIYIDNSGGTISYVDSFTIALN